jgi:hypothetical protein
MGKAEEAKEAKEAGWAVGYMRASSRVLGKLARG